MLAAILIQLASHDLGKVWQDPALHSAIVGACVVDTNGKELYAHNADLFMIPASNQKLVTAAGVLKRLGPDYRPVTKFWKLRDKVVIDSTGDPLMSHDDLLNIKQQLKVGKPRNVEVRSSYGPLLPPGWEWDDLPNKYAAPISAFSVDRSSFELWTENGKLFFFPEAYGAKVFYHPSDAASRVTYNPQTMVADVWGKLPVEKTRLDTLALRDPDLAAASIFGKNPKRVSIVPTSEPTLVYQGKTLAEILKDELPSSDNNVSENLLMMGLAASPNVTDMFQEGLATISSDLFFNPYAMRIADGSGLSRHNVITPRTLARLLVWADQQDTKDLWHSCLAKPGEEGTLKNRLLGVPFEGKTGSMDKVSALSGYLHLNGGKDLIVVVLVNNYLCSTAQTRDLIDQFVKNVQAAWNEGTLFAESYKHAGTRPDARTSRSFVDRLR